MYWHIFMFFAISTKQNNFRDLLLAVLGDLNIPFANINDGDQPMQCHQRPYIYFLLIIITVIAIVINISRSTYQI